MTRSKDNIRFARALPLVAFALSTVAARADIVYVDFPPETYILGAPDLDLEGDGMLDFDFRMAGDCPAGCALFMYGTRAGNDIVVSEQNPTLAAALRWGAAIGPTSDYGRNATLAYFDAGGCSSGPWCEPGRTLFLGLRFMSAGSTHYAWMRTQSGSLMLLDYAYETAPDTPITAGAGFPCIGDLNADNQIGLADLAILLAHFGLGPPAPQDYADGDLDGDGDVDVTDLASMLTSFGQLCP